MAGGKATGGSYTSKRRQHGLGPQIVGAGGRKSQKAKPLDTTPGPLAYHGEDAVICPECGVGLAPTSDPRVQGVIRKHARFGWPARAGSKPPCRGALLEPAKSSPDEFPVLSEKQARARRLVSKSMVAKRYGLGLREVAALIRNQPGFPRPVARLDGTATNLYEAEPVARFMRHLEGR